MTSVYDVPPRKLIEEAARELAKMPEMAPPSWASYVKTGVHNERPPAEENWWYIRCAAVLRTVYLRGPIGVSKLRTKYGGRKNQGHKPDSAFKGSGNILRKILQKLEIIGFLKQDQVGVHKGRITTSKGHSFLDKISKKLQPAPKPQKAEEAKPEHAKAKASKKEEPADHKEQKAKQPKADEPEHKDEEHKKESHSSEEHKESHPKQEAHVAEEHPKAEHKKAKEEHAKEHPKAEAHVEHDHKEHPKDSEEKPKKARKKPAKSVKEDDKVQKSGKEE